MLLAPRSTPLRLLALAGLAGAAALLSNALAPPSRQLAWSGPRALLPPAPPSIAKPVLPEPVSPPSSSPERKPAPLNPPPRERKTPGLTPPEPSKTPSATSDSAPQAPIRDISESEAWAAFQSGVPFLDARRSSEFNEGHVAGAWCAPIWESDLDDRLIEFKAARRPGPDDPIVIYCSGGDCRDSHLLAAKLLNEGYYHLLIYRDGYPDWVAKAHPIEKGRP